MAERARRREIIKLYNQGLTQAQIAEKLGVSVKTVSRDWRKLHGYIERLKWAQQKKITALLDESLNQVPKVMRFQLLGALLTADERTKTHAFKALLAGDIAALRLMLLRARDE